MAIEFLPILKAIPTILGMLSEVTSSLSARRTSGAVLKVEERTKKLEDDLLKAGTALSELVKQVQAVAEELRVQAEINTAHEKRVNLLLWISVVALIGSTTTMAMVFFAR